MTKDIDLNSGLEYKVLIYNLSYNHFYQNGRSYACSHCGYMNTNIQCPQIEAHIAVSFDYKFEQYTILDERYLFDCRSCLHQSLIPDMYSMVPLVGVRTRNPYYQLNMPYNTYSMSVVYKMTIVEFLQYLGNKTCIY